MDILFKIFVTLIILLLILGVAIIHIAIITSIETISLIDIFGFCFIGVFDLIAILGLTFATVKLFRE